MSPSGALASTPVEVEGKRRHLQLPVGARPLLARPVAVDLDPVALGIVEVERLRDEVVGGAREPVPGLGHPAERAGELGAVGDEQREVEQPRRPGRARRRVGPFDERHEGGVATRRAELDDVAVAAHLTQPDRVAVERGLGVGVGNGQHDVAEGGGRVDRHSGSTGSPSRTRPGCSTPPQTPNGSGSSVSTCER